MIFLVIVSGSACNAPESEQFGLPKASEIPKLREQALAGSGVAARRLALWHMYKPSGEETYERWTRIGAQNGDAVSQYNLALSYLIDRIEEPQSEERGLFWLRKAAAGGSAKAAEELRERGKRGRERP